MVLKRNREANNCPMPGKTKLHQNDVTNELYLLLNDFVVMSFGCKILPMHVVQIDSYVQINPLAPCFKIIAQRIL